MVVTRRIKQYLRLLATLAAAWTLGPALAAEGHDATGVDYQRARYSPLHFRPAIQQASNEQCLACHSEILTRRPRERSPAGVTAASAKAWYQQLSTYQGAQADFHRRHLDTGLGKSLMNLQCNTCHDGVDPRDKHPLSSATSPRDGGFRMRKTVMPETTCLKCHGQMNWQVMGLPGPWKESREMFQNNCLLCHEGIRTQRHQVNYLKPEAIETAGKESGDACYGCHGGRAWYRITYPYPRHPWPGMAEETPDWAKGRPTRSEVRFVTGASEKGQQP